MITKWIKWLITLLFGVHFHKWGKWTFIEEFHGKYVFLGGGNQIRRVYVRLCEDCGHPERKHVDLL